MRCNNNLLINFMNKTWQLFSLFLIAVGTLSCSTKPHALDQNHRYIVNDYYLQKEDYFTTYFLIKWDEEKQMSNKVVNEPIRSIAWKKNTIFIQTDRIDFLSIDTSKPLPRFLQNSTTQTDIEQLEFTFMEPHQAWEELINERANRGKWVQLIIGLTVIVTLAAGAIWMVKQLKSAEEFRDVG